MPYKPLLHQLTPSHVPAWLAHLKPDLLSNVSASTAATWLVEAFDDLEQGSKAFAPDDWSYLSYIARIVPMGEATRSLRADDPATLELVRAMAVLMEGITLGTYLLPVVPDAEHPATGPSPRWTHPVARWAMAIDAAGVAAAWREAAVLDLAWDRMAESLLEYVVRVPREEP